tara:strand:- start:190 stop:621 length:432 start_codon:yes stop_codon:yes gene_type:complete
MEKLDCKGLYALKDGVIKPYEVDETKRIIMCGVPGAFTGDCTYKHLPGFVKNLDKLKEKGIDKVIFVSVNDAFVMEEWNKLHGHKDIDSVSDPLAKFAKSRQKDVDWGESFGIRSHRYAYLIENGTITKEFLDPLIEGVIKEL